MNLLRCSRSLGAVVSPAMGVGLAWLAVALSAAENLDRGVVVLPLEGGRVYVGWRLLASDPAGVAFEVERAPQPDGPWRRIGPGPVADSCNLIDAEAPRGPVFYRVRQAGRDGGASTPASVTAGDPARNYIRLPLRSQQRAQKVGIADLDGDGRLDYVVKTPDFNTDPYQREGYWKRSEDTYKLDAYRHDGTHLWHYDMGWAIEEGIWYSPVVVFDLTGDGRAEVFCKAGEGDPREPTGHVMKGPEYLVMLDGQTGSMRQKIPWPSRDGIDEYNYYSRNLLGIAYLDGRQPHLIVQRGTYTLIKVHAYDALLKQVWYWESSGPDQKYRGQGMHGMHAADIDDDGRDELILGSAVLDDTGQGLWNRGVGHPDACYVADIDPARPGLEIFYGIEPRQKSNAVCLVEARSGRMLWGNPEPTVHVHSQGMAADLLPEHPGMECYAGEAKGGTNFWLFTAGGRLLGHENLGDLAPRAVFWLDGPTKVYETGGRLYQYPRRVVGQIEGRVVAIADCVGDWREELITALPGEIRIYTTSVPSQTRRVCLMQDRLYRNDVAVQTMGYFYPPQLGGYPVPVP